VSLEPITAEEKLANALACYDALQTAAGRKYDQLRAETKEWSDIAYEMWALLCNSEAIESQHEWEQARNRLRDRFHVALERHHADAARLAESKETP
jgi:hypothetical protein